MSVFYRSSALLLVACGCALARAAEPPRCIEVKDCDITCAAGGGLQQTMWASGSDVTPAFWGRAVGDRIACRVELDRARHDLHLGVRYSYAAAHYLSAGGGRPAPRVLSLVIDGATAVDVAVPDTGWWDLFEVTDVALPPLAKGPHTFELTSPADHVATNVDCFILHAGALDDLPAPLRSTQVAVSPSKRFTLRCTPGAPLKMKPAEIFREFDRIYDHYRDYMGWAPPVPIHIHLVEAECWGDGGQTAYQNNWGVFFRAEVFDREQGNWCHEMTHMFYVAHFPWWFDESSVHALTIFNWMPDLFPDARTRGDREHEQKVRQAAHVLLDDSTRTSEAVEPIQYAIRLKYGPDVFRRFFRLCREAGQREDLDFTPGRHLTKAEIVEYMSQAAGEDVEPLYRRWTGFAQAP